MDATARSNGSQKRVPVIVEIDLIRSKADDRNRAQNRPAGRDRSARSRGRSAAYAAHQRAYRRRSVDGLAQEPCRRLRPHPARLPARRSPLPGRLARRRRLVMFWSRKDLSKVITAPALKMIFGAASFAALRLEQLVGPAGSGS